MREPPCGAPTSDEQLSEPYCSMYVSNTAVTLLYTSASIPQWNYYIIIDVLVNKNNFPGAMREPPCGAPTFEEQLSEPYCSMYVSSTAVTLLYTSASIPQWNHYAILVYW